MRWTRLWPFVCSESFREQCSFTNSGAPSLKSGSPGTEEYCQGSVTALGFAPRQEIARTTWKQSRLLSNSKFGLWREQCCCICGYTNALPARKLKWKFSSIIFILQNKKDYAICYYLFPPDLFPQQPPSVHTLRNRGVPHLTPFWSFTSPLFLSRGY